MHKHQKICNVERCRKDCIKEVSRKKQLSQFDEVSEHADFDLADKRVLTSDLLSLHQTYLAQLLQMMLSHAGTAEMKSSLNLANTQRTTYLQQKPIDIPILSPKRILKLCFIPDAQAIGTLLQIDRTRAWLIIPASRTIA